MTCISIQYDYDQIETHDKKTLEGNSYRGLFISPFHLFCALLYEVNLSVMKPLINIWIVTLRYLFVR